MPIRDYTGAAKPTTLFPGITATDTSFTVADGTGYPLGGAAGNFVITIDVGRAAEEKILCSARSGNSFTVATGGRGWDGTTAAAHDSQAPVQHTYSATDAREANAHVNDTTGDPHPQYRLDSDAIAASTVSFTPAAGIAATQVQAAIEEVVSDANAAYVAKTLVDAKGDLLVGSAADALARLAPGADGQVLKANAAAALGVEWGAAGAGAELLALTAYRPGTEVTNGTTSTAFVDADATNLAVTFTMPASGRVLVRLTATVSISTASAFWGLREGTADVADSASHAASATTSRASLALLITGTAGASRTLKWAHRTNNATYEAKIFSGPANGTSMIEVWAA